MLDYDSWSCHFIWSFKIKSHDEQTGGGSPEMIGDGYEHGWNERVEMSFDVESDNCRSKGAHQIFDLTIRCVRKYIDAAAVLCKPLAAFLCKSLERRDFRGAWWPENEIVTWQTFTDFLISTSVQVRNLNTRLRYHCIQIASQSACWKVKQVLQEASSHSFNVSKEAL